MLTHPRASDGGMYPIDRRPHHNDTPMIILILTPEKIRTQGGPRKAIDLSGVVKKVFFEILQYLIFSFHFKSIAINMNAAKNQF